MLHSFERTDGSNPTAGVIQARDGNFYGTTWGYPTGGNGTVFKVTPSGKFTTLHNFGGNDGAEPYGGLVQATNGMLYGTTSASDTGYGTVFKISPRGKLTTLRNFQSTDGGYPLAGLIQARDGNLYGTTAEGGVHNAGTVFKITPQGELTTLHSFRGYPFPEGALPYAGLVQASDGSFYGTTRLGGASNGGTIFRITPGGKLTTLYYFCDSNGCSGADGYAPYGGLIQGTDGTFYGTTFRGGTSGDCNNGFGTGCGVVFSLH